MSTGGCPQFVLKRIELLMDSFEIYCVEYDFLSPDYVVQRNKVIQLIGDRFISLGENKSRLLEIINNIKPEIIFIEEFCESFISNEICKSIFSKDRTYKIFESTHSSNDSSKSKRFLPDKFIFVSEFSKRMYENLGADSVVIEYPIDKKEKRKEEAISKLNLDPNSIHVLNIGLFTPGKNQGYAFEIARQFEGKNVTFHFVGNRAGNFKNYWEPLMKDVPSNCVLWGERSDTDDFINASDLFLFTSKFELNPLVIKEALCYDIPIAMFNLETYCDVYDNQENISFLSGDLQMDSSKLEDLIIQRGLNYISIKNQDIGYVLYSNDKYFDIVSTACKSIREFSSLPIYVYMLNSDLKVKIKNVTTIRWNCDIGIDDNMYFSQGSNFYINRNNFNIYKLLIQRPLIVKDVLEKYLDVVAYVDSDSVATPYVDNIFEFYKNTNYPYFVEGVYDYLFANGRGGAETKEDLTNTLEHPACELFSVNQKIRERYRQTGYFVASKRCLDFLEEWYWMCINPTIIKNNEFYAPYNEETILNVLLWKKGILDGLPYIYINGNLDNIIDIYDKIHNVTQHLGTLGDELEKWVRLPLSKDCLLFFHGEKDIKKMEQMIEKIKELHD